MQLIKDLSRRDFLAIIISLSCITLLSWLYLLKMAADMSMPKGMEPMHIQVWDIGYFGMMFLMWGVMMIGMMLPSATPMILIYAGVARKSTTQGNPIAPTSAFVCGYIAIWIIFSFFATLLQWGLNKVALLSPMMVSNSVWFGVTLFIVAGVYQMLPFKDKCLQHCRTPIHFITTHWRSGSKGAVIMGLSHGCFCLGCCWVLMLLLFFGGVMNLLWVAAITLFVLLEKVLPLGDKGGRVMGVVMIIVGLIISLI